MSNAVPQRLSEEVSNATEAVLERVLQAISGRVYSPRIKLLDMKQVREATGLAERTIWRMVQEETFPKPQKNLGKSMWRESTLIAWMDANDPNRKAG